MSQAEMAAIEKMINVDELSAILRVHPNTVRERARRGDIPGYKLNKDAPWQFRLSEVLDRMRQPASASSA